MATAEQLVTRAYRRLQAIDINEEPSDTEMSHALDVMSEMVNGWNGSVTTQTFTVTGDLTSGDDVVRNVSDVGDIMIGLNVSGTGIAALTTVKEVQSGNTIRLSLAATSNLGSATLTITFLPIPAQFEGALVALLAVRLSEDIGLPVSPKLLMDSNGGWADILAGYIPDRKTVYDRGLARPANLEVVS